MPIKPVAPVEGQASTSGPASKAVNAPCSPPLQPGRSGADSTTVPAPSPERRAWSDAHAAIGRSCPHLEVEPIAPDAAAQRLRALASPATASRFPIGAAAVGQRRANPGVASEALLDPGRHRRPKAGGLGAACSDAAGWPALSSPPSAWGRWPGPDRARQLSRLKLCGPHVR